MTPTDHTELHDPDHSSNMTSTYIRVVVIEALIIAALWILGRAFS